MIRSPCVPSLSILTDVKDIILTVMFLFVCMSSVLSRPAVRELPSKQMVDYDEETQRALCVSWKGVSTQGRGSGCFFESEHSFQEQSERYHNIYYNM